MDLSIKETNLLHYLGKNWVIAFILTIPILFFFPHPKRYKTSVEITGSNAQDKIFYDDLNGDGNSERIEIRAYTRLKNIPSIYVEENGKFLYEWITSGHVPPNESSISGDYDHDSLKEVYLVTYENDSVFLSGVVPYKKKVIIDKKFITCFTLFQGNNGLDISRLFLTDLNGDGFRELVIFIYSGFAYNNRKVIAYDIKNDTLTYSPKSGWNILWNFYKYDWDQDSLPEFTGGFPAWGNCTEPGYPYTDSIAWLMVLDNDLSFKFDPVPIGKYSSVVYVVPFLFGNTATLAVLYNQNGVNDSSFIALYTQAGKLIKKKYIAIPAGSRSFLFADPEQEYRKLYILGPELRQLDSSLRVIRSIDKPYFSFVRRFDADGDGIKEYLVRDNAKNRFVIYRKNFKNPASIDIPDINGRMYISLIRKQNAPAKIFLELMPYTYEITYARNKFYLFKWLFIPVMIFLFLFLIIYGFAYILQERVKQHYQNERRILELQIKAVKNQVDPHFTLNMVNTIGSLFMRKETDQAYRMFTRYARMLQTTISASDNVAISLHKELEYVRNYLEIQQFRLENKFTYTIDTAKDINENKIKIPRMLVYTFVENAVKHGIGPLKEKGKIDIKVYQKNKKVVIEIIDNGIGRKQAVEHPALSTGKGLKILDEIIELFFKIENRKIRYELTDGKEGGTVARIYIPQQ